MARHISVGLDIGTHQVKAVIAEEILVSGRVVPRVIGQGSAEAKGIHRGYILNPGEVGRCVRLALDKAENMAQVKAKRAFVSVGGIGLGSALTHGSVAISRADLEVTNLDLEKAHEAALAAIPETLSRNRRIINSIPLATLLDGKPVLGRVEGMKAGQLQVKILFITCLEHHLEDLIRAVESAGVEVIDVVAAPIASSFVTLSKKQKKAGCLLLNIGSETISLVVFENGNPLSLEVFEMGGNDLTNDIALGLKISLDEAESIKLGAYTRTDYPKKKLDDIIFGRVSKMFDLVEGYLKKIGRHGLLPAGVVLTGGSAGLPDLRLFAEEFFKLPARVGEIHFGGEEKHSTKDLAWSAAYGLAIVGFNAENEQGSVGQKGIERLAEGSRKGLRAITHWLGKFLP